MTEIVVVKSEAEAAAKLSEIVRSSDDLVETINGESVLLLCTSCKGLLKRITDYLKEDSSVDVTVSRQKTFVNRIKVVSEDINPLCGRGLNVLAALVDERVIRKPMLGPFYDMLDSRIRSRFSYAGGRILSLRS